MKIIPIERKVSQYEKKEKTLILSFEQLNPAIPEIIMIANQLTSLLESLSPFKLGCGDG